MTQKDIKNKKRDLLKIPVYVDLLPPCNNTCPAGENIQKWLDHLKKGQIYEAWACIMKTNPLPAIHGRICYHPCETSCNRKKYDETINIHSIERFLGDLALENSWPVPIEKIKETNKKILIVGSGPAGLSAAYYLRSFGHQVVIWEEKPYWGGMMRSGIPSYRLPRHILDTEVTRIKNMGIEIKLNHPFTELNTDTKKFDAIFLALGAEKEKTIELPSNNPMPILGAIDFLKSIELKKNPKIRQKIAIYGGGNTAIDVARSARRLGIPEIKIIYRRDRAHMPAFDFEIEEALEEQIEFVFLHTIKEVLRNQIILEEMKLDEQNKLSKSGKIEIIEADSLILALGQNPKTGCLRNISEITFNGDGTVIIDDKMNTTYPGIFAGGDMTTHDRSVTIATGHGRKAAYRIDAYLRNKSYTKPIKHELAAYDILHFDWTEKKEAIRKKLLFPTERADNFNEVVLGINKDEALQEASRCLSCGNCFECDACYEICPVNAIIKLGAGKRYRIDLNTCIGCGRCFYRCPCGAIKMIDTKKETKK